MHCKRCLVHHARQQENQKLKALSSYAHSRRFTQFVGGGVHPAGNLVLRDIFDFRFWASNETRCLSPFAHARAT